MTMTAPNRVMDQAAGRDWVLYNGDSAEALPGLPDRSVDFSIFSPPFSSTYTYSPSDRDLGNVPDDETFWEQFGFISRELLRIMKPGRIVAVHVADLPSYENTHGYSGRRDFHGAAIRHFQSAGFLYHSIKGIQKNPQAQAIRTHSKGLLFVQLGRDSAAMWQAWADYVLVFRTPGRNEMPLTGELTQEEWIDDAHPFHLEDGTRADEAVPAPPPGAREVWEEIRRSDLSFDEWWRTNGSVWTGIRETEVLGTHEAREHDDERHLCALQLPVIERCVRLWSGRGETVLSPFAGIGSEGVGALKHGRKFVGVELKPSYFRVAARNLRAAELDADAPVLWQ